MCCDFSYLLAAYCGVLLSLHCFSVQNVSCNVSQSFEKKGLRFHGSVPQAWCNQQQKLMVCGMWEKNHFSTIKQSNCLKCLQEWGISMLHQLVSIPADCIARQCYDTFFSEHTHSVSFTAHCAFHSNLTGIIGCIL